MTMLPVHTIRRALALAATGTVTAALLAATPSADTNPAGR